LSLILPPLPYLRLGIAAGALALAAGGGCTLRGVKADRDIAALKLEHTATLLEAERKSNANAAASAATGARIVEIAQEVTDALQLAQAETARARATLSSTQRGLRDAFAASSPPRCPDPGNPAAVAAAESSDMVRADLFDRATGFAVELAGAVDDQHAYARACAARYRSVAEELRALREAVR
jgi:hypothetical protein